MNKNISLLLEVILLTAVAAEADVLKLKQEGGVQGVLVSANSKEVTFMGMDGAQKSYPVSAVAGFDFAPLPTPPAPKAAPLPFRSGCSRFRLGPRLLCV